MEKEKQQENSTYPRGLLSRKGTPLASGARLPSVRTPRDLTLGGMKKRTFAPNLVARKDKTSEVSVKKEVEQTVKSFKKEKPHKNKGRGKNRPEFVQSQGSIFSEGPGHRLIKRVSVSYGNRSDSIPKSREASHSTFKKDTKEDDEHCLRKLTCDDFIDDPDSNSETDDLNPVFLPFKQENKKIKQEHKKIKQEVETDDNLLTEVEEKVRKICFANDPVSIDFHGEQLAEMLNESILKDFNPYIFLTMPPVLPTFPSSDNKLDGGNRPSTSVQESSHQKEEKEEDCQQNLSLADLPEGLIGNLEITKSGKVKLKLGCVNFIVEMGVQSNFLQDLVSIKVPDEGKGDLTVLGPVKWRLICIPDIESLL